MTVIEDIHWAEPALLDILSDLGTRVQGSVLFLFPARPDLVDRSPSWGGGRPSFSAIYLDPLPRDDASRLVTLLLEVEDLPGDLHDRIVERAGGNPFFAEEIVRHLIDRRSAAPDGASDDGDAAAAMPIPDTVQAVIAARIDLLRPDEKRALQAAAVVGRIFWPAPVARYLDTTPAGVTELFRGLESRDLVLSRLDSSMRGQAEFIFKHALVRDVAYESIPKRDRAMAHLEIVRWIEEAVGDRRREVVELLAYHYTAAQRAAAWGRVEPDRREEIRARAVALLFDAADEAGRLFAMDRAMERVTTGLELASGPVEQSRGLEALSRLALWRDDGDEAWRAAREAVDLRMAAPGPVDRRAVARLCGHLLSMPTRWPGLLRTLPTREEAAPYLELGFSMLDPGDSEERMGLLLAKAAWGWGFADADRDPARTEEYRATAEEAIELARRMGRPDLLSAALDTAGAVAQELGGYGLANEYQLQRLDLVPELDDPTEIADIIGTLAWHYMHIGEYRRATELEPSTFTERYGLHLPLIGHRTKLAFHAIALWRLGEWDRFWEAYRDIDATVDHARPITYHLMRLYAAAAYLHDLAGDGAEADRLVAELDLSQETRGDTGVSAARLWIVEILVRRGRLDEARRRLEVADPSRDRQNLDLTYEAWAELLAEQGAWSEAPAIVEAARDWAAHGSLLALPAFADRLEGRMLLATGDPRGRRRAAPRRPGHAGPARRRVGPGTHGAAPGRCAARARSARGGRRGREVRARSPSSSSPLHASRHGLGSCCQLPDEAGQAALQHLVGQVRAADLEVPPRNRPRGGEDRRASGAPRGGWPGDGAVDLDELEAERLDVGLVDAVAVHDDRLAVVDRLYQGVPVALVERRVGDEVGRQVRIVERVGRPQRLALVIRREPVRGVAHIDPVLLGQSFHLDEVVEPLVAGGAGDEEDRMAVAEAPDELDGQLDPLARYHARRLHDEQAARRPSPARCASGGASRDAAGGGPPRSRTRSG